MFKNFTLDDNLVAEVAKSCDVDPDQIEDVFPAIFTQVDYVRPDKAIMFIITITLSDHLDRDRWCEAIRKVVALNPILRIRVVESSQGWVNVVTNEEHVTEHHTHGSLEDFTWDALSDGNRPDPGRPLFRTALMEKSFVSAIHHSIMDFQTLQTFFGIDVLSVYEGAEPRDLPPFKKFVEHFADSDEAKVKKFWKSRLAGAPALYPPKNPEKPQTCQNAELIKNIKIEDPPMHLMQAYTEAAFALTLSTFADSNNVTYGQILGGRSMPCDGLENCLGPLNVEVPAQAAIKRKMTVRDFVKDRAMATRELSSDTYNLQYGQDKISEISQNAKTSCDFQSALNIIPPSLQKAHEKDDTTEEDSKRAPATLERVDWIGRGSRPILFKVMVLHDGLQAEVRYDDEIVPKCDMDRFCTRFEHLVMRLISASPETTLDEVLSASSSDVLQIIDWNQQHKISLDGIMEHPHMSKTLEDKLLNLGPDDSVWIIEQQDPLALAPIGSTGEIALAPKSKAEEFWRQSTLSDARHKSKDNAWLDKTGQLGKFNNDGSITWLGARENKITLRGSSIQLETVETAILAFSTVRDVVCTTRVHKGRTQLLAVICLHTAGADAKTPKPLIAVDDDDAGRELERIRAKMSETSLSAAEMPSVWVQVEALPRSQDYFGSVDRAAVDDWLAAEKLF